MMRNNDSIIDEISKLDPIDEPQLAAAWNASSDKSELRDRIMHLPTNAAPRAPRQSRTRRGFVLATTLAVLSLATVATAVSLFTSDSTAVGCQLPGGDVSVLNAVTGDPIVDCQHEWQARKGQPAPELVAYDNGAGGVVVIPASESPSDGWQRLEPGVVQNVAIIELEVALDDYADGLRADCHLLEEATELAERELQRLGLANWSVVSERGQADGNETCTYFYLKPEDRRVALIPLTGVAPPADHPAARFARQLGDELSSKCLDLGQAEAVSHELAADAGLEYDPGRELGVATEGFFVNTLVDWRADCTRVDVNVGGVVVVTLRGPE